MNTNKNWTTPDGLHDGGCSYGPGYCITWQRGPLNEGDGRNGAFLLDVLGACMVQLEYYQNSRFECEENRQALLSLTETINHLQSRRDRRAQEGTLGTTKV
ncbi:MAG: hypothetical protein ACFB0G_11140 [Leptolyngbyaceae cyanobacterium]